MTRHLVLVSTEPRQASNLGHEVRVAPSSARDPGLVLQDPVVAPRELSGEHRARRAVGEHAQRLDELRWLVDLELGVDHADTHREPLHGVVARAVLALALVDRREALANPRPALGERRGGGMHRDARVVPSRAVEVAVAALLRRDPRGVAMTAAGGGLAGALWAEGWTSTVEWAFDAV